jgi:hypothetical protein
VINVNYFTPASNVLTKTPARDFLKTSACCLIPSLLSDLIIDSPRRHTCNFDGILFKRTETTVFPPYLFHRTIFSASCLRSLYSRTATKKAMTQYRCFLYPALNFASADTQWYTLNADRLIDRPLHADIFTKDCPVNTKIAHFKFTQTFGRMTTESHPKLWTVALKYMFGHDYSKCVPEA